MKYVKEMPKKEYRRREWEEWYADAKEYRAKHGDLLIPKAYITEEGFRLGRWIERQRALYNGTPKRTGHLDGAQIALLDAIDMVWKLENRYSWSEWMNAVEEYYKAHGDLDVSGDYRHEEMALGSWIREQRRYYHAGTLSKKKIKALEEYGMIWTFGYNHSWEEWYEEASKYYAKRGDLLVSKGYTTECGDLFVWIDAQRMKYKKNKLTEEQIGDLNAIGMVWDLKARRSDMWDEMYAQVAEYQKRTGRLPLLKSDVLSINGKSMFYWIASQKEAMSKGRMSEERISRLKDIGVYPYCKRA